MHKILSGCLFLLLAACKPEPAAVRVALTKEIDPDETGYTLLGLSERDTVSVNRIYPEVKNAPAGWNDVRVLHCASDFPQALYQAYRAGQVDGETCSFYFRAWGSDTAGYTPRAGRLFISLAVGTDAAGDTCVVFDAGADGDFANDTPVPYREHRPLAVAFERYDRHRFLPDTVWVQLQRHYGRWMLAFRERAVGSVRLHGETFTCRVKPGGLDYRVYPDIYWSDGDTAVRYDPHQYARLGGRYYRIDSVEATGGALYLTESPDALQQESLQAGFRPYSFTTVTRTGQPVRFPDDFRGKTVLLDFWSIGCAPCRQEMRTVYPALYSTYRDSGFEILGIADETSDDLKRFCEQEVIPWMMVADRDSARAIQKLYSVERYPTLFLIDPSGKISSLGGELRGIALEQTLRRHYPDVPAFRSIVPEQWDEWLEARPEVQLVDVRTPEEFSAGAIPGARNIDVGQEGFAEAAAGRLDRSRPVAVYCRSGVRSRKAAMQLVRQGYTVYNLDRGYDGWKNAPRSN